MTIVGVPTEIKSEERRVSLTPEGARVLVSHGHRVLVQAGAGEGSAIEDDDYAAQGATIVADAETVFGEADIVLKVKEPQPVEVALLRRHSVLFTYLHLAPDAVLTEGILTSGATAIAYETVTDRNGRLPLLAPMSEVAGKLAAQAGAYMLERPKGGRGTLLAGVSGVAPGRAMVIGGGVVGKNAAELATGLGAEVYVLDRNLEALREIDALRNGRISTIFSSPLAIEQLLPHVDLVIGAVLVQGARAPHVITRKQLELMRKGSVIVDVAIDQGGCFETSRPTTHSQPTYVVDDVIHYCVANMPAAVPVTSTYALTNATLPYLSKLCDLGPQEALRSDPGFASGLAATRGILASEPVGRAQARDWKPVGDLLAALPR